VPVLTAQIVALAGLVNVIDPGRRTIDPVAAFVCSIAGVVGAVIARATSVCVVVVALAFFPEPQAATTKPTASNVNTRGAERGTGATYPGAAPAGARTLPAMPNVSITTYNS